MKIKRPNKLGKDAYYCFGNYCAVGWIAHTLGRQFGDYHNLYVVERLGVKHKDVNDLIESNDKCSNSAKRIDNLEVWLKEHGHELEKAS